MLTRSTIQSIAITKVTQGHSLVVNKVNLNFEDHGSNSNNDKKTLEKSFTINCM